MRVRNLLLGLVGVLFLGTSSAYAQGGPPGPPKPPTDVTKAMLDLAAKLGAEALKPGVSVSDRNIAISDTGNYNVTVELDRKDDPKGDGAAAIALVDALEGYSPAAGPSVFGRLEVAPLLCEFLVRHPAVIGELHLSDHLANLIDDGVDVALRIGHLDDSSLTARKVGATRRVLVAAPRYLAAHRRLRGPADLAAHATIQFTALTPTREWRFVARGRELRVPIAPRLVTNSADAAVGHAERGGGVAMVLAYQAAEAIAAGRLQVVLPGFEPPPSPIQLLQTLMSTLVIALGSVR